MSCEEHHKEFSAITAIKAKLLEGCLTESGTFCQSQVVSWGPITGRGVFTYLNTLVSMRWDIFNYKSQKLELKLAELIEILSHLKHPEARLVQGTVLLVFWMPCCEACSSRWLSAWLNMPANSNWAPCLPPYWCFWLKNGRKVLPIALFGPIVMLKNALWWLA